MENPRGAGRSGSAAGRGRTHRETLVEGAEGSRHGATPPRKKSSAESRTEGDRAGRSRTGQDISNAARGGRRSVRSTVKESIIAKGGKCGGHSLSTLAPAVSDAAKVDGNHIKTGLV